MTDLTPQLDAILHGIAFAPISASGYESFARAFLRITGPDATRWLNGMVTNNIKDLTPGQGNYNFLLNAQGRILGDCTIYRESDGTEPAFMLEADSSQLEALHQTLDRFIIMDDVELTAIDYFGGSFLILGPNALDVLRALEAAESLDTPLPDLTPLRIGYYKTADPIKTPPSSLVPSVEITAGAMLQEMLNSLRAAGVTELAPEALEAYRILSGTPKYGTDIRNTETAKDLPQETAQTHALNFNKGCYLGQEIVERIHSRGQVHRTFTPFTLTGSLPAQLPAPLEANGKPAGELTSATQIGDTLYALGYARREALDTHATLTYPDGTATPRKP